MPRANGFTTPAVIGAVVVVAILAALGWYVARQDTSTPQAIETPIEHLGGEDLTTPVVQSHRSFILTSDVNSKSYQPKQPSTYTFSITDDQRSAVKDFATVHEKIMHVIIVRQDLQEFQHVHPEFNAATGHFTLPNLTFPSDGPYRIFADFTPMSAQQGTDGQPLGVTIFEDVTVGTLAKYKPQSLTETARTREFQGYTVQLSASPSPIAAEVSTTLSFNLKQKSKPVTNLEKYLGALGHTVVLRDGDLEFLHTHALDENIAHQSGTVDFVVTFPAAGTYKIFSQFQ